MLRPPLTLRTRLVPLAAAIALATPAGGCNKEGEAQTGQAAPADTAAAPSAASAGEGAAKPAVPAPPPVVPPPAEPATLDDLLALAPAGKSAAFVAFREPGVLVDTAAEAMGFYEQPMTRLALLAAARGDAGMGELAELAKMSGEYAEVRRTFDELRGQVQSAGLALHRGVMVIKDGVHSYVVFASSTPDALPGLLKALKVEGADTVVCKPVTEAPGYTACADSEAELATYKPGKQAAEVRGGLAADLPGVDLDGAHVIARITGDDPVSGALTMTGGELALHVGVPNSDQDLADAREVLAPGKADLLRFVQPGTGFVWARVDPKAMRAKNPDLDQVPPMFSGLVDQFTGEVLMGGSSLPPALQLRIGVGDTSGFAGLVDLGAMFASSVPKTIPGVKGSKIKFGKEKLGGAPALHLALSGLPQLEAIKTKLGFSLDFWLFAADGAVSLVAGAAAADAGKLTAAAPDPATLAALPASLRGSLERGEASVLLHLPLDPLHSPLLDQMLADVKAKNPEFDPELTRMTIALAGPLSSLSMWLTESNDHIVAHASMQMIGDATTEEGKAALAAARSVAAGGDAKAIYEGLIAQYGGSPRLTAYKARAGQGGPGDLVGSAIGAVVGAVAVSLPALAAMGVVEGVEPVGDAPVEAPPAGDTPAKTEPAPKTAPKPKTDTGTKADTGTKTDSGTKADTGTKTDTGTKADTETKADTDTKTDTAARPDPSTRPSTGSGTAPIADPTGEGTRPKRVGRQPAPN